MAGSLLSTVAPIVPVSRTARFTDTHIDMSHGAGGLASRRLIEGLFAPIFGGPLLAPLTDAASLDIGGMRLIARNVLLTYAETHPETAVPLERWYRLVKAANWTSMDDVRRAAPKAKVLNRDRVRFEVAGGNYRLIASFDFRRKTVFIKFLGTHAEYDAIDALTIAIF